MNHHHWSGALGAAALFAFAATGALAHVTFEVQEAAADAPYKAVARVGHGCDGQATREIRIRIPEGVLDVRPMPKAGWQLKTIEGDYAKSHILHGKPVSRGVREVVWTGGELPDPFYDEFVFRSRISGELAGQTIYFPVLQECTAGRAHWVEIPSPGQDADRLTFPAASLRVGATSVTGSTTVSRSKKAGPLVIDQPWSRATPGGAKVAGGYLRITNTGGEPDRLIGGSADFAGRVEVHEMSNVDNVMRMKALDQGLVIAPGQTVELRPGGLHIMFLDLKRPLKEGETAKGVLVFEKAGPIELEFVVRAMGARGDDGAAHGHKH